MDSEQGIGNCEEQRANGAEEPATSRWLFVTISSRRPVTRVGFDKLLRYKTRGLRDQRLREESSAETKRDGDEEPATSRLSLFRGQDSSRAEA